MTVNRYAAGCFMCSLDVLPGGGHLLHREGGWHVFCRNCYNYDRASSRGEEPRPRPGPPPGCRHTIALRVLGLSRECWKCHATSMCVAALYPDRHANEIHSLIGCGDEQALNVARAILEADGRGDLAATINPRHSKTMRVIHAPCSLCQIYPERRHVYMKNGLFRERM